MHDLAVIGLGALGTHVALAAAKQGFDVVGLESGTGDHEHSATGGQTRIFRLAYTFGSDYIPALQRSLTFWNGLSSRCPETRFETGALMIGDATDPEIAKAVIAAERCNLPHEILDAAEVSTRWPMHRLLSGDIALYDPAGSLLIPPAITALVRADAEALGASLRYKSPVNAVRETARGNVITLDSGEEISARQIVVTAGAWSGRFAPEFDSDVELRRVILHWFSTPKPFAYGPTQFPVGLRRTGDIRYSFFPQIDENGIKVNLHSPKRVVGRPDMREVVLPSDFDQLVGGLNETLTGLGERTGSAAYVESYTPDYRILLGRVANTKDRWLLAGGSGQAFKLAPVLAEHLVQLIQEEKPSLSLEGVARSPGSPVLETIPGP